MASPAIPEIETERLILRRPVSADIEHWVGFLGDPDFGRYVPRSRANRTPRERAERTIRGLQALWEQQPLSAMGWAITRKGDSQFIGQCNIDALPETNDMELSYLLGKPYWGQGFATEAARAAVCFGFEHTTWDRIVAGVVPANVASWRVLEHLGFVHEKDVNYYEMTGSDAIIMDDPIVAYYALRRERFAPGDAFYRLHDAPRPSQLTL